VILGRRSHVDTVTFTGHAQVLARIES
jgi:hypothetical protein